ncbi:MAG: hypothetical protein ABI388_02205, partial [Bacteroidia bacterium]
MEKYKILENRPELTPEEVMQGMNFDQIKKNVVAPKKGFLKSFLIKGIIATISITSLILVYTNYHNNISKHQNQIILSDTIHKKNNLPKDSPIINQSIKLERPTQKNILTKKIALQNMAISTNKQFVDSLNHTFPIIEKTSSPVGSGVSASDKTKTPMDTLAENENINIESTKYIKTFRSSSNATCKIWTKEVFCSTLSSSKFISSFYCNDCSYDELSCNELSQQKNVSGIWLKLTVTKTTKFKLTSRFKNILLIKTIDGS